MEEYVYRSRCPENSFSLQVLLFLAAAWPISEKSAVNLKGESPCLFSPHISLAGEVHLENVTTFEDEAAFAVAEAEEVTLSVDYTEAVLSQSCYCGI